MMDPAHQTGEAPPRLSAELLSLAEIEEHNELTLGGLMERLQGRIYTLFLILLSLPFCQPVLLPGLSTPFGLVIALLGLRFAFRQHPWLPRRLLETRLTGRAVPAILRASAKLLGVMEKLLHPRMVGIFERQLTQFLTGIVFFICGALLLLPLPIPFSNIFPAFTVVLGAAAFSERDGWCLAAAAVMFLLTVVFFGGLVWGGAELVGWMGHA
jgi:hypothetical protein